MITFESLSNIDCLKPNSRINWTALHTAKASNISTEVVFFFCFFFYNAAMTCPAWFLTTTPIPAWSDSENIALSKFVFHIIAAVGGCHLTSRCLGTLTLWLECFWNSVRSEAADSIIFPSGRHCSLHLILFLWHQIDHATVAKSSNCFHCLPTDETRSENNANIG